MSRDFGVIGGFIVGIILGASAFWGYISLTKPKQTEVLASVVEASVTPTPEPPTPTDTPEPDPTDTPTPKPTKKPSPTPTGTPTEPPAPTSTPDVWSPPTMEPLFAQYAGVYGVDKNVLERIANCESHFNPNAINGDYLGMFQFASGTWIKYRNLLGTDANISLRSNIEESIRTAAFAVSKAGTSPWPSCL